MTKAERKQLGRFVATGPACAVNLASYLKSKQPKRRPISSRKTEKKQERLAKKGWWDAVKEKVGIRANGTCECGCGFLLVGDWYRPGGDADHFFGKHRETVETVWQLSRLCHNAKGENRPSREHWDRLFAKHCAKHGYPLPRKRFCKSLARLPSQSEPHDRMERSVETAGGRSLSTESK